MDKISIGIEKRIPISTLELALSAVLDDTASSAYFKELAMRDCSGENRIKKVMCLLKRLTLRNPILPYIKENKEVIYNMLRTPTDRPLLFVSIMCSAYTLFYDTVRILGKYLHVQESVNRAYLLQKLAEKYGSNRSLGVAFDCVMPMLIETGIIKRLSPGNFSIIHQEKYSEEALKIYKESFLLNNPIILPEDDCMSNSYFEFITNN